MQKLFRPLVYLVVPTAAFLTFLLQPIVGKELMPRYGGTAGTWMTISLFFQTALLGGYALAAKLLKGPRRTTWSVMATLAVLGPLSLKLPPWNVSAWSEWPAVLASLALSLLPTMLLTTGVGLVVQGWIQSREGEVPYRLYGISNLGSLLALLLYPFAIEPSIGLSRQVIVARGLLGVLSLATLGLVWIDSRREGIIREIEPEIPEAIPRRRVALWVTLGALTCTLMLGGVRTLSAEIGSNPLSWLIPLGTYLLSFSLAFSGWWSRRYTLAALAALTLCLFGYMVTKGFSNAVLSYWPRLWLVGMISSGTLAGHGLLYQLRPERRFSFFYVAIAVAGMFAGLFASVGAPLLFDRNFEFAGSAFVLSGLIGVYSVPREGWAERGVFLLVLLAPAGWFGVQRIWEERHLAVSKITYLRNYYSTIVLNDSPSYLTAMNETTLHGTQLHDPAKKDTPTTYYTRGSGGGMVISALQAKYPSIRIGVIGLGTGTLAAYPRKNDSIIFWDINPLAEKVARNYFSFLRDCPGQVEVRLMDGRIGVRAAKEHFDALVVDAFSGDYVPLHLLTREAMGEYLEKVGDGVLLFHVSNRYTNLVPVIAASARHFGRSVRSLTATPGQTIRTEEEAARTRYVLVYPKSRDDEVDQWISEQMKRTDYDYQLEFPPETNAIEWTDDRHAIVDVLGK